MSSSFIKMIQDAVLKPEMVQSAASSLGENPENVTNAITALVPTLMSKITNKAETTEGASSIMDLAKNVFNSGTLSNMSSFFGSDNSSLTSGIFSSLLGDEKAKWFDAIAQFSGIKSSSAESLSGFVGSNILGSIGKNALENNLSTGDLTSFLGNEKGFLSNLLPAGLTGILSSFGLGSLFGNIGSTVSNVTESVVDGVSDITDKGVDMVKDTAASVVSGVNSMTEEVKEGGSSLMKWLLPLLALLLLGAVAFFMMKGCSGCKKPDCTKDSLNNVSTSGITNDSLTNGNDTLTIKRESMVVTLPSGKTINAFKGGIEDQIVTFLKSDDYKTATAEQLKEKWFNFDNLNFDFGKATITKESLVQVENLKAILAEFKDAKVKIGAYSDKKGDDALNLKLSQERAKAVKAAVGSTQIVEAEGYGETQAKVAETASDKEREADRKTAIRFIK